MLSVDEALTLVLAESRQLESQTLPLGVELIGAVAAADVTSDVDSPPYDKSVVDGFAVIAADLPAGQAELELIEEVTAGQVPTRTVERGQCTRIMTGAPIPTGADAVVMVERTELIETGRSPRVSMTVKAIGPGDNIMRRATSMRRGDVVLRAGSPLRPIELGVLAEVGCCQVPVIRRPTISVLSTGNELVPVGSVPTAGQIRNSNSWLLTACAERAGGVSRDLGIARDEPAELERLIATGLESDVLVLSGGVSAGVLDLVPGVLSSLGVRQVFHKVSIKPGKPIWFGVRESGKSRTLVFGLPGNPVSSLVCFELFVRPAIGRLAGRERSQLTRLMARLATGFEQHGDRPTYHPAALQWPAALEPPTVQPLRWQGSGDLRTLVDANSLAHFPAGQRQFAAGDAVEVYVF